MLTEKLKPSLSDYDYALPRELIAAYPPERRTDARLLCVDRSAGHCSHHVFRDLARFLRPGDLLVLNNTKVIPARIFGKKETGGKVEALLLKSFGRGEWSALLRPGGRIRRDSLITFGEDDVELKARVLTDGQPDSGERRIRFEDPEIQIKLARIGHIPLPPYLDRPDTALDRELYQTVFAKEEGAVASPTAGLHFDQELLEEVRRQGVEMVYVTLHVSYATFKPISDEDLSAHQMFEEEFEVLPQAACQINQALCQKRRIIACGTTTVRTLESACDESGEVRAQRGRTKLFIYPPYTFRITGGMITNFHLPKSSLLLLVSAFLGRGKLFQAYQEAIRERYRFYSYGDAMVIL